MSGWESGPRCGDCGAPYDVPSDDGCSRHLSTKTVTQSGKALRALLPASQRREVTGSARALSNGLWRALDACDDLLEDSPADSLTMPERVALKTIREHVLSAFATLRSGTADLSGTTPREAVEAKVNRLSQPAPERENEQDVHS